MLYMPFGMFFKRKYVKRRKGGKEKVKKGMGKKIEKIMVLKTGEKVTNKQTFFLKFLLFGMGIISSFIQYAPLMTSPA